jgi:hypothetical protein
MPTEEFCRAAAPRGRICTWCSRISPPKPIASIPAIIKGRGAISRRARTRRCRGLFPTARIANGITRTQRSGGTRWRSILEQQVFRPRPSKLSRIGSGAGYQPVAALWAALGFKLRKSLLEEGCRLESPPHKMRSRTFQIGTSTDSRWVVESIFRIRSPKLMSSKSQPADLADT